MPKPTNNARTQNDLKILESLLAPILQESFTERKDSFFALNIACGRADETGTLLRCLSPLSQSLHLTGIDIRDRELSDARKRWPSTSQADISFVKHDASKLKLLSTLPNEVDLVMMRHQNFWNGAETWIRIYDSALKQLSPNGRLIITSYFDREHRQAVQAISSLGAQLLHTFQNPRSRVILKQPLKSIDRHIAVFMRKNEEQTDLQSVI
ncbi:class I SAM-dependent methyltransferase [Rubritalea spongiae]|uniref:Class I SAM-dependent methyltransferase n=1 Tax=Rubritalea spongiae TaxID=430797 RepID=A0ABW5DXV5_9BACT